MEAVAMAMASCSGMDVVMILKKMRVELKKLDINVDAKRRDEDPSYFTDIKLTFTASGDNLAKEQLAKAVGLSVEKYCSVAAMLRDKAAITYETVVE
jgi:putative redox protein